MTVVFRHNDQLELNFAEYLGSVTTAELIAIAEFLTATPAWLKYDCLSLVSPGADFVSVDRLAVDAIYLKYRTLYAPLNMTIVRRSAWVCRSETADDFVRYWLSSHSANGGLSSELQKFDGLTEAGAWLSLTPAEIAILASGDGFKDIVRVHHPAGILAR